MNTGRKIWLHVLRVGTKYYHSPDFELNRPRGSGDYIFIKFLKPAELTLRDNVRIAQPGNCIFFSPRFPHKLKGYNTGLGNDWMHLEGPFIKQCLEQYNLPLNHIIPTLNTAFVREILDKLKAELTEPVAIQSDRFMEIYVEMLCLNLARSIHYEQELHLSPTKKEHLENFRKVRARMLDSFTEDWTVEKIAEEVYMSSSRFAVLYKEFFNASPIAELINARIEHAKWLLTSTTLSIKQVSQQSGFQNVYYFSRKFKERVDCSPSSFRLQGLNIRK
mgnify:CR=1 FL=1